MLATLPGRTQGLGLITEPLLSDLKLDRVLYANLNLWTTLIGAAFCFPAGWAIDRFGLKYVTALITLLLGLVVWRISAIAGSVSLLFTLLLLTRAFGQSALSVASITTVGKWFRERVGIGMSVFSVLLSVLFAAAFGIIGYAVRQYGWRAAWLGVALGLMFVITPVVLWFLREPLQSERSTDFSPLPADATARKSQTEFTLGQALRTRAFWIFAGAAASFNLVSSGLGLFNESVLDQQGFPRETFHHFLVITTLLSLAGQFACGWMLTRWKFKTLTAAGLLLYGAGLAAIPLVHTQATLWIVAVLIGGAGGMIIVIFFSVWSAVFGREHLGRIQGAAQMLTVLSSAIGPVLFAKCFELSGSYTPLLWFLAGAVALLAVYARLVPDAKRRESATVSS